MAKRGPGPEAGIKNQICQWLAYQTQPRPLFWVQETVGVFDPVKKIYRKSPSPWKRNGVADILGIWPPYALAIEVKAPGGELSWDQFDFLQHFREKGGIGVVATNSSELEAGIRSEVKRLAERSDLGLPPGVSEAPEQFKSIRIGKRPKQIRMAARLTGKTAPASVSPCESRGEAYPDSTS